jgi:signal transduction histidine kinase
MSSARDARARAAAAVPGAFGLRVALWYAALFVVGSLAIVSLAYFLTASSLERRDRDVLDQAVGRYATEYARGGLAQLTDTVRAEQSTAPERLFVRVVDGESEAIVLSMPNGWDPAQLETATARLSDSTLIQVGKSAEIREELLSRFRATLGVVLLSVVGVALAGGWIATRSATAPIRKLIAAFRRIVRTGRTDERVPIAGAGGRAGGGDAIDELSRLFNAMLDRIEGLVTAMRESLDNVSHDLRTPLTHLRVAAETALAAPPDAGRERDALADSIEEVDRVLVILDSLMEITEAQSGTLQLHRESVRLAEVAARALELYRDVAEARGVVLVAGDGVFPAADGVRDAVTLGERARLERVAANLIDNAVKYTPAGGRVEISVGRAGDEALLSVRDTGRGIPPADLPRIWERLFRGDASRSEHGLGLGLSVVRAIVEAHGGRIEVASEVGRGSTFVVHLPALDRAAPKE